MLCSSHIQIAVLSELRSVGFVPMRAEETHESHHVIHGRHANKLTASALVNVKLDVLGVDRHLLGDVGDEPGDEFRTVE